MNLENTACIVMTSSEDVISDVSTSLGLLQMKVLGASSLSEAKAALVSGDGEPVLVLVERDLSDLEGAGLKMAQSVREHPSFGKVPVCVLASSTDADDEAAAIEIDSTFNGVFNLPVEFPDFTRQVKDFLEGFRARDTPSLASPAKEKESQEENIVTPSLQKEEPVAVEAVSSRPVQNARLLDRRMVVAYGIQLAVLEELEKSKEFQESSAEDIPEIVAKMTLKVASEFTTAALTDEVTS